MRCVSTQLQTIAARAVFGVCRESYRPTQVRVGAAVVRAIARVVPVGQAFAACDQQQSVSGLWRGRHGSQAAAAAQHTGHEGWASESPAVPASVAALPEGCNANSSADVLVVAACAT